MEDGWKAAKEWIFGGDLAVYLVSLGECQFERNGFFYVADSARTMRVFAHDAIPPVEGTARRCRERDEFSVGFDGAGVRAAMARGRQ